jgi:hypothetical protein
VAAAAVTWIIAYNARCELSLAGQRTPSLDTLHRDRQQYLELRW